MARDSSIASARPTFPVFLLPSFKIPFRRRRTDSSISSAASNASFSASLSDSSQSSAATTPSGSPPSLSYFPKSDVRSPTHQPTARRLSRTQPDTLRCSTCAADLAFGAQIVSKGFTGRYGRAYLVSPPPEGDATAGRDLINARVGKPESRQLVTGWHTVADISCAVCGAKLGWKYVDAKEQSQKYKVGKFILETERVVGYRSWEDVETDVVEVDPAIARRRREASPDPVAVEEVVFDSDDEDECEDIFAGTWDPQVVAKRRSKKLTTRKKHAE